MAAALIASPFDHHPPFDRETLRRLANFGLSGFVPVQAVAVAAAAAAAAAAHLRSSPLWFDPFCHFQCGADKLARPSPTPPSNVKRLK